MDRGEISYYLLRGSSRCCSSKILEEGSKCTCNREFSLVNLGTEDCGELDLAALNVWGFARFCHREGNTLSLKGTDNSRFEPGFTKSLF